MDSESEEDPNDGASIASLQSGFVPRLPSTISQHDDEENQDYGDKIMEEDMQDMSQGNRKGGVDDDMNV